MLAPVSVYGTGGDPKEEESKAKKEKPDTKKANKKNTEDSLDIYESENKVLDRVEIPSFENNSPKKESTNSKSYRQNINDNTEAEEEDPNSAMSFNIIYYIIDKFKFTDPLQ